MQSNNGWCDRPEGVRNAMDRILVIDDDVELTDLLIEDLQAEDFELEACHDGPSGLEQALSGEFDAVVLDLMLPKMNGFEVLSGIRAEAPSLPVLMLSARGEAEDRTLGLEMGADDYLAKPFSSPELVARIHALLRRSRLVKAPVVDRSILKTGDVVLDIGSRTVRRGQDWIELTTAEFEVLRVLLSEAGHCVSRERLFREALDRQSSPDDRSIDNHISSLRRKLGPGVDGRDRIKTVRYVGYQYVVSASSE
jgi:two-component system response regulator CpxR